MGRQAGSAIRLRIEAPSPHELRCLVLIERLFQNLSVEPFATCRVAPGWRLQLPIRDWVIFHFILQGEGGLRVGSGEVLPLRPDCLGIMPPRLTHSIESGSDVQHESSVRGDEPGAPICRLGAGPSEDVGVVVACGRIQVTYGGGGPGLFDRLEEAIVLDFSDSPPMRTTFESLVAEFGTGEPGSSAMMTALMNQCLISVFRRLSDQRWFGAHLEEHSIRDLPRRLKGPRTRGCKEDRNRRDRPGHPNLLPLMRGGISSKERSNRQGAFFPLSDGRRLQPQVVNGAFTAPHSEYRSPAGNLVQGRDVPREHRGVTGDRIGDARCQLDPSCPICTESESRPGISKDGL